MTRSSAAAKRNSKPGTSRLLNPRPMSHEGYTWLILPIRQATSSNLLHRIVAEPTEPCKPVQRSQWRGSPPVKVAHNPHYCWHDQHPHNGGIESDRDRQADPDRFDEDDLGETEGEEDRHHNGRGTGDQATAALQP